MEGVGALAYLAPSRAALLNIYTCTYIYIYINKNTWGVKKCEAKKNQRPKALISVRAKKFIPSQQFITNFYFKARSNLQGVFPTMIGFVTLGHLLFRGSCKKGGQGLQSQSWLGKHPVNCCVITA